VPGYTPGSGWLDQVRGGWYQQHAAAATRWSAGDRACAASAWTHLEPGGAGV
jgi:hypothetical protein